MKKLLAIGAMLGASLVGVVAPAHADDGTPDSELSTSVAIRSLLRTAPLFSTPRDAGAIGEVSAGEQVVALCGFTNTTSDWVKVVKDVERVPILGYVRAEHVDGHISGLPSTCPSEVTSVPVTAFARSFRPTESAIVGTFHCPAGYPYLQKGGGNYGLVTGIKVATTGDSVVSIGVPTSKDGYESGYTGGFAGNAVGSGGSVSVIATCTSDKLQAKRA